LQEDDEAFSIVDRIKKNVNQISLAIENEGKNIKQISFLDEVCDLKISCSFGITYFNYEIIEREFGTDEIIATADKALYLSKYKGKNSLNILEMKDKC